VEQPDIEITLASQSSPELAGALMRGKVDVAFLRREKDAPGIAFKPLIREPLVVVLPAGHRLAAQKAVRVRLRGRNLCHADAGGAGAESGDRELRGEVRRRAEKSPEFPAQLWPADSSSRSPTIFVSLRMVTT
jgi:DNA-binding transcriptional LysR family regulator